MTETDAPTDDDKSWRGEDGLFVGEDEMRWQWRSGEGRKRILCNRGTVAHDNHFCDAFSTSQWNHLPPGTQPVNIGPWHHRGKLELVELVNGISDQWSGPACHTVLIALEPTRVQCQRQLSRFNSTALPPCPHVEIPCCHHRLYLNCRLCLMHHHLASTAMHEIYSSCTS